MAVKTTVKYAVEVEPSDNVPTGFVNIKPGLSLSKFVRVTVCELTLIKSESELGLTEAVIDTVWLPSIINSSTLSRDRV